MKTAGLISVFAILFAKKILFANNSIMNNCHIFVCLYYIFSIFQSRKNIFLNRIVKVFFSCFIFLNTNCIVSFHFLPEGNEIQPNIYIFFL